MRGWVYVISNDAMPGRVKVGFSSKDPDARAREFDSAALPHPYLVDYDVLVDEPYTIEQQVHARLQYCHEGKEWFRCSSEEAALAIRALVGDRAIHERFKRADRQKADELQREEEERLTRETSARLAEQELLKQRAAEDQARRHREAQAAEEEWERAVAKEAVYYNSGNVKVTSVRFVYGDNALNISDLQRAWVYTVEERASPFASGSFLCGLFSVMLFMAVKKSLIPERLRFYLAIILAVILGVASLSLLVKALGLPWRDVHILRVRTQTGELEPLSSKNKWRITMIHYWLQQAIAAHKATQVVPSTGVKGHPDSRN